MDESRIRRIKALRRVVLIRADVDLNRLLPCGDCRCVEGVLAERWASGGTFASGDARCGWTDQARPSIPESGSGPGVNPRVRDRSRPALRALAQRLHLRRAVR